MSAEHGHPAFISGGARGIGAAIAHELHRRGHPVAIGDLRVQEARERAAAIAAEAPIQAPVLAVSLDVCERRSVEDALAECQERLGPIAVLVNNAGHDELVPFVQTDEDFWQRIIEINFKGALRVTRALLPGMIERRYGRIVSISSDAARVGSSLESVYAGAKAALIAFTKTIARETARSGVSANIVCPGPTRTPLLDQLRQPGEQGGEALIEAMIRAVPMRRLAEPDEIAHAVGFFASERSGYITGQTLSVSGGLTMA